MIQSMTGFAEKSFISRTLAAKITVKSLNHRFFDWTYKGAPIGNVENRLRALSQKKFRRGRVEVFLELSFPDSSSWDVVVNEGLLEKLVAAVERVSKRFGRSAELSLDSILRIPQLVELRRKDLSGKDVAFLESCFERTLDAVKKSRMKEGRETETQLRRHVLNIRRSVGRMEKLIRNQPTLIHEKLKARLKGLNQETPLSEERLAEESAYLAQRYDLAEEIVRIKSHLATLFELLSPKIKDPVGKNLDFLAQELYREANTSNAKSQDIEIIKESLSIKGEIESIRQQVQNIE